MDKIDLKQQMRAYWAPRKDRFEIIDVPDFAYVMVDGAGDPNTAASYANAVQWLYSISYAVKFASKAAGRDYSVAPLEAWWWSEDWGSFASGERDKWQWTAMIMQPEFVTAAMVEAGIAKAGTKLGVAPGSLRFERFAEGPSVQIMHVGPYSDEGPVLATLHREFLPANGLRERGKHHEIYLGDPRKSAPERLKTVLRQPVERL